MLAYIPLVKFTPSSNVCCHDARMVFACCTFLLLCLLFSVPNTHLIYYSDFVCINHPPLSFQCGDEDEEDVCEGGLGGEGGARPHLLCAASSNCREDTGACRWKVGPTG